MIYELPFNLPGKIYASPMPFGHFDTNRDILSLYKLNFIAAVVVLADESECIYYTGLDLLALYLNEGLAVVHYPIDDFGIPHDYGIDEPVSKALALAKEGRSIAVHCHAGMGRTSLFCACMAGKEFGMSGADALKWIEAHHPHVYMMDEQRMFVAGYLNGMIRGRLKQL